MPTLMGNKTINHKKSDGKQTDGSRLSLAARMLGGAVRATIPVPPPKESWRKNKANNKNCNNQRGKTT